MLLGELLAIDGLGLRPLTPETGEVPTRSACAAGSSRRPGG